MSEPHHIVGVGASAGGLEALERFFAEVPPRSGMAFVVIQHLSPNFRSMMDELLARHTSLPVQRVTHGDQVQADHVYLIPADKEMILSGGRLFLSERPRGSLLNRPIDVFLRSLAREQRGRAVAVILSGSGTDGSRGAAAVQELGGLVIAQSPETAGFDGMPRAVLDCGAADLSVPPEDMPGALVRYAHHNLGRAEPHETDEDKIEAVFHLLQQEFGLDFSRYKPSTVHRRIRRRVLLQHADGLQAYVDRLSQDPGELDRLYRDLLVGVTRFFRDEEAFDALAEAVDGVVKRFGGEEELRAWVPGCATGEEAYTVAILLLEAVRAEGASARVKVFATDVHGGAIEAASTGRYAREQVVDVPSDLLARYFDVEGRHYRVRAELRQAVVFARHNVLEDPPFTRLHVVTCRNLLIYLRPEAQRRVVDVCHFALRKGGLLMLGPSENAGATQDELQTLDARWRLYAKKFDLPIERRLQRGSRAALGAAPPPRASVRNVDARHRLLDVYDALLEDFMPPGLLVGRDHRVVHTFGGASRYLRLEDGRLSTDVLDLVDPEIKLALTGALQRAKNDEQPVTYTGVTTSSEEDGRLELRVRPIKAARAEEPWLLVLFAPVNHDERAPSAPPESESVVRADEAHAEHVSRVEAELRYTRESLQATIEELETSNEELQATNEEMVASNEELHSTNEELQSVNEELYSVNREYQQKITDLAELTHDMEHLLQSIDVATLFMDRRLTIRKVTPRVSEYFNLQADDVGRSVESFTHSLDYPELLDDLKAVADDAGVREREVRSDDGAWLRARLLPYRGEDGEAGGVVLTLIEITALKEAQARAESEVRRRDDFLAMLSHELRNPLGAIVSAAQLIRAPSASSEAVDRAHQVLQRQVGQMSRLLEDLSDMSRLSRDKISIEPRLLSLAQAAREALEVLQAEADDAGVTVSLREEAPGVHVLADEVRLQQVAVNLLSNAIRYSEPGGAVDIRVDARGERAILEVSDEGVGIEPEKLDQIFHPFVQGEPVGTTVGGGMGVGLALVRSIVDIHHGEVRAESAGRGHGATFTVELPAAEPAHEADASGRAGARSVDGAVLLIEDSSDNRLLLTSLLEGRGLEVEAVATAEEGLERMRRTRFGGAIVDLGLPGMSGLELCAAVRSDERLAGLPLIAVTGFGREADRERARATGFDDFLVKPVDAGDLEKALAAAASGRRAK